MASVSKINGKWRALIRRKGYPQKSKWFDTKAAAFAWSSKIEALMDAGKLESTEQGAETIGQLVNKYRRLRGSTRPISDSSTEHYTLKMLERMLGQEVASTLTVDRLLGWAQERRDDGAGPYTINCDLSKLGTVFRYAGTGLPDVIGAARPKLSYLGLIGGGGMRERRATEDEMTRILSWLAENKGAVYSDATLFACITAMRQGEVCRILKADIDHQKKMVLIRDRKDPRKKEGNDQWIPLLGDSWSLALRQVHDDERIFPLEPRTLSKYFTEAVRALSIPDLHFHDTRHDGVSKMFEEGYSIEQVALVSGHKDWRHLRRYTQLKPESLHALGKGQDKPPHP